MGGWVYGCGCLRVCVGVRVGAEIRVGVRMCVSGPLVM